jgi:hypothetical protein
LLCFGGAFGFALLWRSQERDNRRLAVQLTAARGQLAKTQARLATTEAALRSTAAVAARERRGVLLRVQSVLTNVDPLLSSVDELQQTVRGVQRDRTDFANAADTLIGDTVTLASYLVDTDPAEIDATYEQELIDTANADLATVRADATALGSPDTRYGSVSDRFANRADSFTSAVRRLQQQLQQAAPN